MRLSGRRRVNRSSSCPTIGAGIISPASVQIIEVVIYSAPDDHFAGGVQNCGVRISPIRRIRSARRCPAIGAGIVFAAGVNSRRKTFTITAPDNHFGPRPYCSVARSRAGRAGAVCKCPGICGRIVPPARVQKRIVTLPAPYDHLTAGPDCRVLIPGFGWSSGGCPGVRRACSAIVYFRKAIAGVHRDVCSGRIAFRSCQPGLQWFLWPRHCCEL